MKIIHLNDRKSMTYQKSKQLESNTIMVRLVEYSGDCMFIMREVHCFTICAAVRNIRSMKRGES